MDNNPNGERFFVKANIMKIPLHNQAKIAEMQLVLNAIKSALNEESTYEKRGDEIKAIFPDMDVTITAQNNGALKTTFAPHDTKSFTVKLEPMVTKILTNFYYL